MCKLKSSLCLLLILSSIGCTACGNLRTNGVKISEDETLANDTEVQVENFDSIKATESAMILTDHLINYVMVKDWLTSGDVFSSEDVRRFVTSLCLYYNQHSHPYGNNICLSEDGMNYILSQQSIDTISSELFGIEHLSLDKNDGYDDEKKQLKIPNGIGLQNTEFSYEYVDHYVENTDIYINILLKQKNRYEDSESVDYGKYILRFQYVETGTNNYLRFVSIKNNE